MELDSRLVEIVLFCFVKSLQSWNRNNTNSDYYLPSDFLLIRFHNNSKSATRENNKTIV